MARSFPFPAPRLVPFNPRRVDVHIRVLFLLLTHNSFHFLFTHTAAWAAHAAYINPKRTHRTWRMVVRHMRSKDTTPTLWSEGCILKKRILRVILLYMYCTIVALGRRG